MFVVLFRLLFGYVCFNAKGGFTERFINLCSVRKIKIRNIKIYENTLYAETSIKSYKKLKEISHLSGMKIRAIDKRGLPFFAAKNKKRIGLLIGLLLSVIFLIVSTQFVWSIEITGTQEANKRIIQTELEALGLYIGAPKKKINAYELADKAMMSLSGEVSWLAVNIKGSTAVVEARDYIKWREDETYREASNIIADFDGLILSIDVFNGKKEVNEGSAVKKGDLLISGIVENRDLSSQFLDASGEITAKHTVSGKLSQDSLNETTAFADIKRIKKIKILNVTIPLGFFKKEEGYDEFVSENKMKYNGKILPFSIIEVTRLYYKDSDKKLPDVNIFLDFYFQKNYEKMKNTLVTDKKYSIKERNGLLSLEYSYECIDFLGKKEKILIE
ncbi:MAG: sporulation protein YqfD [Clostridia bacterium]|nr:sporulation protein YqfD [Clostridia bacterium]